MLEADYARICAICKSLDRCNPALLRKAVSTWKQRAYEVSLNLDQVSRVFGQQSISVSAYAAKDIFVDMQSAKGVECILLVIFHF